MNTELKVASIESFYRESESLQRDMGRMEAEIKALHIMVGEMRDDLKKVRQSFDELRGGTKFIMAAAAGIGAVIALALNYLSFKH